MCLPILGGIVSGVGAAMGMMAQKAQANAQAELSTRQANIEREAGSYEGARKTEQVERVLGSARAAAASNGVAVAGTTLDVIDESAKEGALDVAAIRWNSGLRVDNNKYEAKVGKMNARIAGMAAPIAFVSPVIDGVAKYVSSFE